MAVLPAWYPEPAEIILKFRRNNGIVRFDVCRSVCIRIQGVVISADFKYQESGS